MNEMPQRKRPVHMPPVERHNAPVILFVTIGVQPRVPCLANKFFHTAFLGACQDADAWSVGCYLIMPDHVHMFGAPANRPSVSIKRWCSYLKERITKRLKARLLEGETVASREEERRMEDGSAQLRPPGDRMESGIVEGETEASRIRWTWQNDCWDTQLRNQQHYSEKWAYVRLNPVRKNLVTCSDDWPWQGQVNELRW